MAISARHHTERDTYRRPRSFDSRMEIGGGRDADGELPGRTGREPRGTTGRKRTGQAGREPGGALCEVL